MTSRSALLALVAIACLAATVAIILAGQNEPEAWPDSRSAKALILTWSCPLVLAVPSIVKWLFPAQQRGVRTCEDCGRLTSVLLPVVGHALCRRCREIATAHLRPLHAPDREPGAEAGQGKDAALHVLRAAGTQPARPGPLQFPAMGQRLNTRGRRS